MTEGMRLVTRYAFGEMKLHRLEANMQPGNLPSIALVRKCGFRFAVTFRPVRAIP
jgi:ribosomal-protein-alanine N-acetyltransferase